MMENKLESLDIFIEKLRRQKPVLTNENVVTDSIMKKIANKPRKPSLPVFIVLVRVISSTAAIFLLALLLFQFMIPEQIDSPQQVIYPVKMEISTHNQCFQSALENEKPDVAAVYFCYMKQNSQNKKSFLSSLTNTVQQYKKQFNENAY